MTTTKPKLGTVAVGFTVTGAPRTKKNRGQIVRAGGTGRPRIIPSKPWTAWVNAATIVDAWRTDVGVGRLDYVGNRARPIRNLRSPVNCRAWFYRDRASGDAVGYYQGLADLLQKHGIVEDDKHLVSWNGSRLLIDRTTPRVEVILTPHEERDGHW